MEHACANTSKKQDLIGRTKYGIPSIFRDLDWHTKLYNTIEDFESVKVSMGGSPQDINDTNMTSNLLIHARVAARRMRPRNIY
jgi:hypothetical protein